MTTKYNITLKVERFFMTMVLVFGTLSGYSSTISPPKNLNVIYILANDLGYGDIGCCGQVKILTPDIDRLASDGLLFTQHYAGFNVGDNNDEKIVLYDLASDFHEDYNVADKYPDIVHKLIELMQKAHKPSPWFNFGQSDGPM